MNAFLLKKKWNILGFMLIATPGITLNLTEGAKGEDKWRTDSQWLYSVMLSRFANHAGDYQSALDNLSDVAEKSKQYGAYKYSFDLALDGLALLKAQKIAIEWQAQYPKDRKAQLSLIRIYLMNDNDEQALSTIKALLDRENDLNTVAQISRLLTYVSDPEQRISLLHSLADLHPENPYIAYYLGMSAKEQGDINLSISAFEKALAIKPSWEEIKILQVKALFSIGEFNEGMEVLRQLRQERKDDTDLLLMEMHVFTDHYQWDEVIKSGRELIKIDSEDMEAYQLLGWAYGKTGDYEAAEKIYQNLNQKGALDDNQLAYQLGQTALNADQYGKAVHFFRSVKRDSNLYMLAQQQIGLAYFKDAKIEKAQGVLDALRARFPDYALEIYIVEIANLDKSYAYAEAEQLLEKALKAYPDQIDLLFSKAEHLTDIKKIDKAIETYKRIITLDKANIDAINAYGYLLLTETDNKEAAEKLILQALEQYGEAPAIQDSYAWMLHLQGKNKRALKWIQKAYSGYQSGEIAGHYVEILVSNGLRERAREVYESEVTAHPDNLFLKQAADKLGLVNESQY